MELKRINNLLVLFIIFCSTAFYNFSILGRLPKVAELAGSMLILFLIVFYIVYSEERSIRRYFIVPVSLILFSIIISMFMANYSRGQSFFQTMYAQNAMYFYLFYILLHKMKIRPGDLEKMFIGLGLLFVVLYLIQYVLYPKLIFDAYIREQRGTIRIYMQGSNYMTVAFYFSVQYFFRTHKVKYLIPLLIIFTVIVMNGGRSTMAVYVIIVVLFLFIDKKVKSRLLLFILSLVGAFAIFLIFRDIFNALILQSKSDAQMGTDYIRFKAAGYFLTDFFKNSASYITGNGTFSGDSRYGKEIEYIALRHQYYLGDIGLIGNYVIYGAFFLMGVLTICVKALRIRVEQRYVYIKYMFISVILSLFTSAAFAEPDYIVLFCCAMYIFDVSKFNLKKEQEVKEGSRKNN